MVTCLQGTEQSFGALCITFTLAISFYVKTTYNKYVEGKFLQQCLSCKNFFNKFFLSSRVEKTYFPLRLSRGITSKKGKEVQQYGQEEKSSQKEKESF